MSLDAYELAQRIKTECRELLYPQAQHQLYYTIRDYLEEKTEFAGTYVGTIPGIIPIPDPTPYTKAKLYINNRLGPLYVQSIDKKSNQFLANEMVRAILNDITQQNQVILQDALTGIGVLTCGEFTPILPLDANPDDCYHIAKAVVEFMISENGSYVDPIPTTSTAGGTGVTTITKVF